MTFFDYEKEIVSAQIPEVLEAIRRQGVEVFCKILEDTNKDGTATIKLHTETDKILIKKGVRQGDTISPKMFTVCLEEIFKKLDWDGEGTKMGDEYLNNLKFADDIVLFSESANEMQLLIKDLNSESRTSNEQEKD